MKKIMLTFSLLLTFGLVTAGVAAQGEASDSEMVDADYSEIAGLQSAYERIFSVDFEVMMESPEADFEDPAMMRMISILGVTFDNEDNASAYLERTQDEFDAEAADNMELMEDIEIADLEGFDVDGMRMTMASPGLEGVVLIAMFVDGNHVFQVVVMDVDLESAEPKLDEVIQFVLDNDVQDEEVVFNEDGTSTGGVFDRMPASGHELVGDLTFVMDMELLPAGMD